jgi:hypothetical protein
MSVRLKFGKHKGRPLEDIPFDYLTWVLREVERLDYWTRQAIEAELRRRIEGTVDERDNHGDGDAADCPRCKAMAQALQKWFREMALKYHPDRGGSNEVMVALGQVHDSLKELMGRE